MKRYLLIPALLFGLIYNVQAQMVSGIVSSATERFNGAVIKNLNSSKQAISDERGTFTIGVKKGDTLLTSRIFYKSDTLIYTGQNYLAIQLKVQKQALKEVTINATKLSPNDVFEDNKKEYKDIYRKGDYSHMFGYSVGMMPGIAVNIDKLYNLLSKQGHDARRMQRTLVRDYHDDVIDHSFTRTLVKEVTGFDSVRVDTFMMKYRPSYAFIVKASKYDVMQYIKDKVALDGKGIINNVCAVENCNHAQPRVENSRQYMFLRNTK